MIFVECKLKKEGSWWVAYSDILDVSSQGKTKSKAKKMLVDAINELSYSQFNNNLKLAEKAFEKGNIFFISTDTKYLYPFALAQLRAKYAKTQQEVADELGFNSKNAYAQYEQGKRKPSEEQFQQFLAIIAGKNAPKFFLAA